MGAVSTFAVAILADRTQQRGMIMIGLAVVTIVGYCMMLFTLNVYGTTGALMFFFIVCILTLEIERLLPDKMHTSLYFSCSQLCRGYYH